MQERLIVRGETTDHLFCHSVIDRRADFLLIEEQEGTDFRMRDRDEFLDDFRISRQRLTRSKRLSQFIAILEVLFTPKCDIKRFLEFFLLRLQFFLLRDEFFLLRLEFFVLREHMDFIVRDRSRHLIERCR